MHIIHLLNIFANCFDLKDSVDTFYASTLALSWRELWKWCVKFMWELFSALVHGSFRDLWQSSRSHQNGKVKCFMFSWNHFVVVHYLYSLPTSLLCELVECFRCLLMSVFQVCPVIIMVLRDYVSAKHMLTWLHLFCYICEWYLYIFCFIYT